MTANIDPLKPAPAQGAAEAPATAGQGSGAFAAALDAAQKSTGAGWLPDGPPPELAAHIAAAYQTWEALAASGRYVSFTSSPGGRTRIELGDDDGSTMLSAGELFALIEREWGA